MAMLGIIGAMTIEVEGLKAMMTDTKEKIIGDMTFACGVLCGKETVVAVSGEGKVNAAMCAQAMIMEYNPSVIINSGVAGGLADGLKIGDIVIASSAVQHDWDASAMGYPLGYVAGTGVEMIELPCDAAVAKLLAECAAEAGFTYKTGIIATGDQFISSDKKRQWLIENFNAAACEMECGAIAHVCLRNGVKFGGIRAVSDGGDDEACISFTEFTELASKNSIRLMSLFAERI